MQVGSTQRRRRAGARAGGGLRAHALVCIGIGAGLAASPGCSPDRPEPSGVVLPSQPEAAEPAPRNQPVQDATALPELPPPGGIALAVEGDRVTLACHDVELARVLAQLAHELEFGLEISGTTLPRATVQLADTPIAAALPVVLAGTRYDAVFQAAGPLHHLVRLRVEGVEGTPGRAGGPSDAAAGDRGASLRAAAERFRSGGDDDPDADPFDPGDEEAREQAAWIERLTASDPRTRAEAAYEVEPEGRGLDALLGLVYDDPDPSVRVAAVSQLEDSDAHAAVQGLIGALSDPDRRVVLEAIDALEFAGDESVIPSLSPLLDSPDPEIRDAAEEAIEFLE